MGILRLIRDLTIGDRTGEAVYAVWMLVVSIGLINATGNPDDPGAVGFVLIAAAVVNVTWGLIDGITAMYTNVIGRAETDRLVYGLRTRSDDSSIRAKAAASLEHTLVGRLSAEELRKVVDMIAAGPILPDPSSTKYRTTRQDRSIAYGILAIDLLFIPPLLLPLLVLIDTPRLGALTSYLIGAISFAFLGAQYAKHLNRNRIAAVVLMGGLMLALAAFTYAVGW